VVLGRCAVALLLCFRTDRGDGVVVTRPLPVLQTVRVPVHFAALAVVLAALPLRGDGTCREQGDDEHQGEQAASE